MKKAGLILGLGLLVLLAGCCQTFNGYGRYILRVDCDKVKIGDATYKITRQGTDLMVADHSFQRGIYRKTRPWLYVHQIQQDKVDITFEEGLKDMYPLYTGASASTSGGFTQPCKLESSTNISFPDDYWLVSHRWSDQGVLFDLQRRIADVTQWQLVRGDILVPGNGTEVQIAEINAKVKITSFNAQDKTAMAHFTQ